MSKETNVGQSEILNIKTKLLHVLGMLNEIFATVEMPSSKAEASQQFLDNLLMKTTANLSLREKKSGVKWTKEEHERFLHALDVVGKNMHTQIAKIIKTKTPQQVSSHSQKFFAKVKKELMKIKEPTKAQMIARAQEIMDNFRIPKSIHASLLYEVFGDSL